MMKTNFLQKNTEKIDPIVKFPLLLWLIVGIFFIKTLFLAFWVIPLWDIQDEPGHYSYILDIANGKGIPVMGKAVFDKTIRENWLEGSWKERYKYNWISQHPPLYYAINSVVLSVSRLFTTDSEFLFRVTRLLSVVSGTAALFVFYLIFLQITHDKSFSLFSTAAISLIPMFGYQSSGTSHDSLLALLCALSILYWAKFIITGDIKYSIIMACFLSLSGFTKTTAYLLFVPMVGICFFYFTENTLKQRILKTSIISIIAMILPGIWMARSYIYYGAFLTDWTTVILHFPRIDITQTNFCQFLTGTTILENLYTSFFGEFGWAAKGGQCMVLLIKNSSKYMPLYYALGSVFIFLSFISYIKMDIELYNKKIRLITLIAVIVLCYFLFIGIPIKFESELLPFLYAVMLSIFIFSLQVIPLFCIENKKYQPLFLRSLTINEKLLSSNKFIFLSLLTCFFYTAIFLITLNGFYNNFHMVRADHGRYWLPVISLLVCGYIFPAFKVLRPHTVCLGLIIFLMFVNEILLYLYYVVPFLNA